MGERERQQMRAREMGLAFADLDRVVVSPEARASISTELARELRALPVKRDGSTLWIAVDEPSTTAIAEIEAFTGLRVFQVLVAASALDGALKKV